MAKDNRNTCFGTTEFSPNSPICSACDDYEDCKEIDNERRKEGNDKEKEKDNKD